MSAQPHLADRPSTRPSLTLQRRLNATPAQVYAAWTDPQKIIQWFGPASTVSGSLNVKALNVRRGGDFRISFNTDNGEYHEIAGVYQEVVPGQKLVFSWAWHSTPERESLVTVTIKAEGKISLLTLTHEKFFDQAARDGHERGWTGTLDKLEKIFA